MDTKSRIIKGEMTSVLDRGIEDQGKREGKANEDLPNQKLVKRCKTYEELMAAVSDYEENTKSNFVSFEHTKNFAKQDFFPNSKSRIHWKSLFEEHEPDSEFYGVPYVIVGRRVLNCHLGKDWSISKARKREKNILSEQTQDHSFIKKRTIIQNTKKMDCPAKLYLYHTISFPDYKIAQNTEKRRKMASKKIKDMLAKNSDELKLIHNYTAQFPDVTNHENHATSGEIANIREKVDQRVRKKVIELYRSGLRTVSDIMRQLNAFVAKELFYDDDIPEFSRRRFYPTRKDIANIIGKLRQEGRNSLLDQENIAKLVHQWEKQVPEDKFYFRANTSCDDNPKQQTFLFCYQAHWQMKMLSMYGNIVLLDATYRTTRYALPLYFLCVRTNVCYLVVGAFVTQEETSEAIQEALVIFQTWNPNWKPDSFMVDFCLEEIKALSKVFPNANVTLCDFHREKSWTEWVKKKDHNVYQHQKEILSMLRNIAYADNMDSFNQALKTLQTSEIWKKKKTVLSLVFNKVAVISKGNPTYQ